MINSNKIIIALDMDVGAARECVKKCLPLVKRYKVGLQLFSDVGPDFVKELNDLGALIFLDLKFHDIPQTVHNATKVVSKLGAFMLTVHASGGEEMMKAAVGGRDESGSDTKIVGVTLLTSLDGKSLVGLGVDKGVDNYVLDLAVLAKDSGLDGVVASVGEVPIIKEKCGVKFLAVTPGIRLASDSKDDQVRVSTPEAAIKSGSDFLVIGRSITHSKDPVSVIKQIVG